MSATSFGVIGAGTIGRALAAHAAKAGHHVLISNSRRPETLTDVAGALGPTVKAVMVAETAEADLVVLAVPFVAVPFVAVPGVGAAVGDWAGRTIVDVTNQFATASYEGRADIGELSGSEWVARHLPGAYVVKAFNAMAGPYVAADPRHAEGRQVVFHADDDAALIETLRVRRGLRRRPGRRRPALAARRIPEPAPRPKAGLGNLMRDQPERNPMMTSPANPQQTVEEVVASFLQRLAKQDADGIGELFADQIDWNVPGSKELPWTGPRSRREHVAEYFRTMWPWFVPGQSTADLEKMVISGDDAVLLADFTHTVAKNGKRLHTPVALHLTITNGQIVRMHLYEDTLAVHEATKD